MIGYVLGCIRLRSPIVINRPGPLQRLRIWMQSRMHCAQCGRRMNALDAGLHFPARGIFYCRACGRDILPGSNPYARFDPTLSDPLGGSGGGGAP